MYIICLFISRVYLPASILICFIIPTIIPRYLWNESLVTAYFICGVLRCVIVLHLTWFVNSAAHMWGMKPYDKGISPSENMFVTIGAGGEGIHKFLFVFFFLFQHQWLVAVHGVSTKPMLGI